MASEQPKEDLGRQTQARDMNRVPNQYEQAARQRKAYDLAAYLKRKGITDTGLQAMHPTILQHHIRSAGLKSPPSEETMKLVRQHLRPPKAKYQPTDPFEGL